MEIDSFLPQTDSQEDPDKDYSTQISFPWEELVKTLKLDINVHWIQLDKWGIHFCERINKQVKI